MHMPAHLVVEATRKHAAIADRFDALLIRNGNFARVKALAEQYFADESLGNVDALKFPDPDDFMRDEENESPLVLGQRAVILAALQAVHCRGVERLIDTPEQKREAMPRKRNSTVYQQYLEACSRFNRWWIILGRVRNPRLEDTAWYEQHLRRIEAELAGCEGEAKPQEVPPKHELLRLSEELQLSGKQAKVIKALAERNCRIPLADLATIADWQVPFGPTWNSMKNTLNEKMKPRGWQLYQHNNCAVAKPITLTKPAQKKRRKMSAS